MPDSAQVYAKHLLSGRGYPLWTPEPSLQLLLYRPDGLRIGDVGVVNPVNGSFDVFFNICLPRNHPFHRATGVPDNFTHVTPLDIDFATHPTAENAGCVISTPSITQDEPPRTDEVSSRGVPSTLNYEFRLPSTDGALLILPQGAESHELLNLDIFEDVAARNGIEWYDFAKRRRGRMISDDALYLITGFHKASSWSLASFQNTRGPREFSARFRATQVGPANVAATYTWQTTRSLDWRVGPTDGGNGLPNQAVFIRGFKIAIRQGILGNRVTVDVDVPTVRLQPSKISRALEHRPRLAKVGGAKISGARPTDVEMQTAKLAADLDSPTRSTQPSSEVSGDSDYNVAEDCVHPSDVINRYLLNKAPSAPVAITHDSVWSSMFGTALAKLEDFRQDGKLDTILSRNFRLVSQDNAVFLQSIARAPYASHWQWTTHKSPNIQRSGQGAVGADPEIPSEDRQDVSNVNQSPTEFITHDKPEGDITSTEAPAMDSREPSGPPLTSLEHLNAEPVCTPSSVLHQNSSLCRLPTNVLEQVVLMLNEDHMHPQILSLLLTCKEVYLSLCFTTNNYLYSRLFLLYFDSTAAIRRYGTASLHSRVLSTQLRLNWMALRTIKRCDIYADGVLSSFWNCFRMMTENDGKNRFHLDTAGLPDFVDRFVRERLYEDSVNGWPAENEINSLAMWLLWLTSTRDRLTTESPTERMDLTHLILPYVLMPVRYASYYAPPTYFTFPIPIQASSATIHGPYPPARKSIQRKMMYYNDTGSVVGVPLASLAAKLVYFSRREAPVNVPPHLPRTRAHSMTLGLTMVGPTQEDVQELMNHRPAKLVQNTVWDWTNETELAEHFVKHAPSASWDDDWNRLVDCNSPSIPIRERLRYSHGLLTGLWHGRMLYPDAGLYADIMHTLEMPSMLSEQAFGLTIAPVYVRLREYHCMDVDSKQPVPTGQDDDSGFTNAWFPKSTRFQNVADGLLITSEGGSCVYNEYVVGGPDLHDETKCRRCQYHRMSDTKFAQDNSAYLALADEILAESSRNDEDDVSNMDTTDDEDNSQEDSDLVVENKCNGILDIVLVGETDDRHGQAWHHFKYYGRVREWDGLVALVRVPTVQSSSLGVWVFTGYVIGGQNFVGNWRTRAYPDDPVTLESAFVMSKCDSEDGDMCDRV